MKKFVEKIEYVSPEMKVKVVDEDIITFSIGVDEDILDEVPLDTGDN